MTERGMLPGMRRVEGIDDSPDDGQEEEEEEQRRSEEVGRKADDEVRCAQAFAMRCAVLMDLSPSLLGDVRSVAMRCPVLTWVPWLYYVRGFWLYNVRGFFPPCYAISGTELEGSGPGDRSAAAVEEREGGQEGRA
eukprot:2240826-Rhodomonas_salina.1